MPLLRHTLDNGVLIASHGDKRNVCMVDCHDGCGAPLIDTRPWLLAFSTRGPGSDMARLAGAIGERRINENMAKAEAFQEQDANRVSCDTRLVPMGGGQNHGEELAWVPAAWRKSSHTPEALRSLGTPWLLSHDIAAARQLPAHWPVPGFGHFLSVHRGDMVACVIPLSPLLERGCSMHECVTFLCHLPWKTLEAFVFTHCLYAELLPGRALWVPYGWRRVLLTRTAASISHVLHIPYVCTRMLQTATFKAEIVAFAKQATQEWSSTTRARILERELARDQHRHSVRGSRSRWLRRSSLGPSTVTRLGSSSTPTAVQTPNPNLEREKTYKRYCVQQ